MLGILVYGVYGGICLIGVLFCFSPEIFNIIDEKLNLQLAERRMNNPLNLTMFSIDGWMKKHNRLSGLVLALLAILDLKLYLGIIDILL